MTVCTSLIGVVADSVTTHCAHLLAPGLFNPWQSGVRSPL